MKFLHAILFLSVFEFATCGSFQAMGQSRKVNYDESKVEMGALPDPLQLEQGLVPTANNWDTYRQRIVKELAENQFGYAPELPFQSAWTLVEEGLMHEGRTRRRQFVLSLENEAGKVDIDVALFTPATMPVRGVFLGLNFLGNHSVDAVPELRIPTTWMANNEANGISDNRASELGRGKQTSRWPVEEIIARGYGLATAFNGDIDPDFDDGFKNGVHQLFPTQVLDQEHPNRWGTIAAWSWGLSRILDGLESMDEGLEKNVAVMGHSRLGKAALWAGVTDPRFAMVISNNSGCGGAAIERRNFGETVAIITNAFPHWFCTNFKKFAGNEHAMPHDSHFIIAAIAPRPVYIASATKDLWADPKGEYLAGYYGSAAYKLFGLEGLSADEPPLPDASVGGHIGYHNRTGDHDIDLYDWRMYMDFADRVWNK